MLRWQHEPDVAWHHIAPAKPQPKRFVESFSGRFRDEFLAAGTDLCLRANMRGRPS